MAKNPYTNLYYELEKRGWSYEHFAGLVFSTSRSVENWCKGYTIPFRPTQSAILKVLELDSIKGLFEFKKI